MKIFGGIDSSLAQYDTASVLLQPVPYDGTSTWGKGSDRALEAFLEASENMELYDIETDSEVYRHGIHILPPITEKASPGKVYTAVLKKTEELLETGKYLSFLGGEHSISIGIIEAFRKKYPKLTVLQLDAHTDLRESYLGSPYNHACALHQARKTTNLIQVGIRSMDSSEKAFLDPEKCYFWEKIRGTEGWMEESLAQMGSEVYITVDLDVLDPAVMPATGTPEPGGPDWDILIRYLKKVFTNRNVVGFDIVEFAPVENLKAPGFLVAKLYYKMLSYKFFYE